jgi:hypothetical protein
LACPAKDYTWANWVTLALSIVGVMSALYVCLRLTGLTAPAIAKAVEPVLAQRRQRLRRIDLFLQQNALA